MITHTPGPNGTTHATCDARHSVYEYRGTKPTDVAYPTWAAVHQDCDGREGES